MSVNREIRLLSLRDDPVANLVETDDGVIYIKRVKGVPDLFYRTSDGGITRLTENGTVVGNVSSNIAASSGTNNTVAVFDGTDGDTLKEGSGVTIDGTTIASTIPLELGSSPASTGDIRLSNDTAIMGNSSGGVNNINLIHLSSGDSIVLGGTSFGATRPGTVSIDASSSFEVKIGGSHSLIIDSASIRSRESIITFDQQVVNPIIRHTQASSGAGDTLTIQAQDAASGSGLDGGNLVLQSGSLDGAGDDGEINISKGTTMSVIGSVGTQVYVGGTAAAATRPVNVFLDSSATSGLQIAGSTIVSANAASTSISNVLLINTSAGPVATTGAIRLPNGSAGYIYARNAANTQNVLIAGVDKSQNVYIGDITYTPELILDAQNRIRARKPIMVNTTGGTVATTGDIRMRHSGGIYGRTSGGTNVQMLNLGSGSGYLYIGDTNASGLIVNSASGGSYSFQINSTQYLGVTNTTITLGSDIQFNNSLASPTISQATTSSATGQTLTIKAQDAATTGGDLFLAPGSGGTANGVVDIDGPIRLPEVNTPSAVANHGHIYVQDTGGIAELFYIDDTGTTTQLTADGYTNAPGSGTDNHIVRWNGTTGLQDSEVEIDDSGNTYLINTARLFGTNSAGTIDFNLIGTDGANNIYVGHTSGDNGLYLSSGSAVRIRNSTTVKFIVDGSTTEIVDPLEVNTTAGAVPTTGSIRLPNGSTNGIYSELASVDLHLLSFNAGFVTIGNQTASSSGTLIDAPSGDPILLRNGNNGTIRVTSSALQFENQVTATIQVEESSSGNGNPLTLTAGNAFTTGGGDGGNLIMRSGDPDGAGDDGEIVMTRGSAGYSVINSSGSTLQFGDTSTSGVSLVQLRADNTVQLVTTGEARFQVTTVEARFNVPSLEIGLAMSNPSIYQEDDPTSSITGDTLTIHAQNATGATSTGGTLALDAGSGTGTDGDVTIGTSNTNIVNIGPSLEVNTNAGTVATSGSMRVASGFTLVGRSTLSTDATILEWTTINQAALGNNSLQTLIRASNRTEFNIGGSELLQFDSSGVVFDTAVSTPSIYQADDSTSSITGDTLTIHAQNATGTTSTGGDLVLSAGTGTSTNGIVTITDALEVATRAGTVATTGDIRLRNTGGIVWTTAGGSDLLGIQVDSNDIVQIGDSASGGIVLNTSSSGNIALHNSPAAYQGGQQILFVANRNAAPTGNPSGGTFVYAESGALKARGTSGTITTMAAADPHCPDCGRDFALEWNSEQYGYLAVCIWCLTEELGNKGVISKRE